MHRGLWIDLDYALTESIVAGDYAYRTYVWYFSTTLWYIITTGEIECQKADSENILRNYAWLAT
jgi:hypothetical protein